MDAILQKIKLFSRTFRESFALLRFSLPSILIRWCLNSTFYSIFSSLHKIYKWKYGFLIVNLIVSFNKFRARREGI